jgi:hypothetical protein
MSDKIIAVLIMPGIPLVLTILICYIEKKNWRISKFLRDLSSGPGGLPHP